MSARGRPGRRAPAATSGSRSRPRRGSRTTRSSSRCPPSSSRRRRRSTRGLGAAQPRAGPPRLARVVRRVRGGEGAGLRAPRCGRRPRREPGRRAAAAISRSAPCEVRWFTVGEPADDGAGFRDGRLTAGGAAPIWVRSRSTRRRCAPMPRAAATAAHAFGVGDARDRRRHRVASRPNPTGASRSPPSTRCPVRRQLEGDEPARDDRRCRRGRRGRPDRRRRRAKGIDLSPLASARTSPRRRGRDRELGGGGSRGLRGPGPGSGRRIDRGGDEARVRDGIRRRNGAARPRLRELGHVPRLRVSAATASPPPPGRSRSRTPEREQHRRRLPTAAGPAAGPAGRTPEHPGAGPTCEARRTLALLLGSTAFLVGSGLVMVLSASSVTAFAEYGDSFLFVQRQAAYAVVGVLALLLTSRMRYDAWKRLAGPFLLVTMAMLDPGRWSPRTASRPTVPRDGSGSGPSRCSRPSSRSSP